MNKSDWGSRFAALAGQTFAYHSLLSRVLIVFYSGQVIDSSLLLQSPYPPAGAAGQHAAFVPAAGGLPALDPGDAGSLRRHRGPLPTPTTSSRAPRRSPILSRRRRAPAHATCSGQTALGIHFPSFRSFLSRCVFLSELGARPDAHPGLLQRNGVTATLRSRSPPSQIMNHSTHATYSFRLPALLWRRHIFLRISNVGYLRRCSSPPMTAEWRRRRASRSRPWAWPSVPFSPTGMSCWYRDR